MTKHTNEALNPEEVSQVIVNGKVYDKYVAGEEPEGKCFLLAIPLTLKTDTYTKDGKQKSFSYYAKIGNFNRAIKIANDFYLKLTAHPPADVGVEGGNSDFCL